jgi:hypothetical protein
MLPRRDYICQISKTLDDRRILSGYEKRVTKEERSGGGSGDFPLVGPRPADF